MPEARINSQFESPDDSPGFSLWQVSNLWQKRINAGLNPLDLTHVQFVLLATLAWHSQGGGLMTQVELAALARTDVMMTSNVLRTLEKKGLIRRAPHPQDSRAKTIAMTELGQDRIGRAIVVVETIDADFFRPLEAEVAGFNRQLLTLVSAQQDVPGVE
jgi:DNA-binding MarR family transcriptional regulator